MLDRRPDSLVGVEGRFDKRDLQRVADVMTGHVRNDAGGITTGIDHFATDPWPLLLGAEPPQRLCEFRVAQLATAIVGATDNEVLVGSRHR